MIIFLFFFTTSSRRSQVKQKYQRPNVLQKHGNTANG